MRLDGQVPLGAEKVTYRMAETASRATRKSYGFEYTQVNHRWGRGVRQTNTCQPNDPDQGLGNHLE